MRKRDISIFSGVHLVRLGLKEGHEAIDSATCLVTAGSGDWLILTACGAPVLFLLEEFNGGTAGKR